MTITDEYLNQDVIGLRFDGAHIETKFTGSRISNSTFNNCRLDRVLMAKTRWDRCEFNHSILVAHFNDALFQECQFKGTTFKGLSGQYGGVRAKFINCDFTGAKFMHVFLRACRFQDCNLENAEFIRCDLRGATSNGTPLQGG